MVRRVIEPETQAVGRQLDVLIADAVSGEALDQAVTIVRGAYKQFLRSLVIEMRSHIKGEAESFLRVIGRKRSRVAERKQRVPGYFVNDLQLPRRRTPANLPNDSISDAQLGFDALAQHLGLTMVQALPNHLLHFVIKRIADQRPGYSLELYGCDCVPLINIRAGRFRIRR